MRIDNRTHYDTSYLRKLFVRCEKESGTNHKGRKVKVSYSRDNWIGGYGWYNAKKVTILLPKEPESADAREIAQVYIHEVDHNLGLRHKEMMPCNEIPVDWWPQESVPFSIPKPEPKKDIVLERAKKVQDQLKKWLRKEAEAKKDLAKCQTHIKKWKKKLRYYIKKLGEGLGQEEKENES